MPKSARREKKGRKARTTKEGGKDKRTFSFLPLWRYEETKETAFMSLPVFFIYSNSHFIKWSIPGKKNVLAKTFFGVCGRLGGKGYPIYNLKHIQRATSILVMLLQEFPNFVFFSLFLLWWLAYSTVELE